MTPAELLVAAADRIDQARADATDGPWDPEGDVVYGPERDELVPGICETYWSTPNAAWIALLNPQAGEHIAALLRAVAIAERHGLLCSTTILATATELARAIVGGEQ